VGGKPQLPVRLPAGANAFDHPDAQRRFRVMASAEELARALDFPWEKWTVFLHPAQRQLVERSYNGPARVMGSAGTGKTIVALHRAVFLARKNEDARVLLATFSDALANALRTKLRYLISNEPRFALPLHLQIRGDRSAPQRFAGSLAQHGLKCVRTRRQAEAQIEPTAVDAAQFPRPGEASRASLRVGESGHRRDCVAHATGSPSAAPGIEYPAPVDVRPSLITGASAGHRIAPAKPSVS